MIIGIGIDLFAIKRIEQELERGEWIATDGVFTAGEIAYCRMKRRPAQHFAARFAAKEAILKALGVTPPDLAIMREAEVIVEDSGRPMLRLSGRLNIEAEAQVVRHISLSLSHSDGLAMAVVILEG